MASSRIFSIRLDDSAVEALERLQSIDDESLNATAKRVMLDALGIDVNIPVNAVNNDERLQELVDAKTAYLATAINEIKHSLESEIEVLRLRLDSLTPATAATVTPETTPQIDDEALLESAIAVETTPQAVKPLSKEELKSKANSIARTFKNKGLIINQAVIKSKILEMYPNSDDWISDDARLDVIRALEKQQDWKGKTTDFLDGVNWQ
jgi:predicted metal-dependent hydrolase